MAWMQTHDTRLGDDVRRIALAIVVDRGLMRICRIERLCILAQMAETPQ
jgi:hypothetical protein